MVSKKEKTIKDLIPEIKIDKELKEMKEDKFALQRMAEKLREVCGDKYVFLLFDANHAPKIGDTLTINNLSATFRKRK